MLQPTKPGPEVVVCSTCRASSEARDGDGGQRGGALLAEAMRQVQSEKPELAGVAVQEMPCLFACSRHCSVHIRAPGKVGYVLGDFAPDREAALAILTYAALHKESEAGVVRYGDWPDGVKGHFIVRTPPEGFVCT